MEFPNILGLSRGLLLADSFTPSFHLLRPRTRHANAAFGVDNVSQPTELAASHRDGYHRLGGHFSALDVRISGQYMLAGACWPSCEALPVWGKYFGTPKSNRPVVDIRIGRSTCSMIDYCVLRGNLEIINIVAE